MGTATADVEVEAEVVSSELARLSIRNNDDLRLLQLLSVLLFFPPVFTG